MLSFPDAQLAARDPAIPGLALLFDPDAFGSALRRALPSLKVEEVHPTYVRYKPGTNCLVAYSVKVNGCQTRLYGKALNQRSHGLEKARGALARGVAGPLGPAGLILDEALTALYAFPNDRGMEALASATESKSRETLLRNCLPGRPELWNASIRTLAYKPERRYVGQLLVEGEVSASLRIYEKRDYDASRRGACAFTSQGMLQVPRRLGGSEQDWSLVMEWLPGSQLLQLIRERQAEPGVMAAVGRALATLHRQPGGTLPVLSPAESGWMFQPAAEAVAAVCPDLARRALDLARRLVAALCREVYEICPLHGDFSADQVVLDGGSVGFVDFDLAVRGDPAHDLGWFIAHLEHEALAGRLARSEAEAMAGELLEAYGAESGRQISKQRVDICLAAGMLRCARRPFRYREADWPAKTLAYLQRAEEIAAGV